MNKFAKYSILLGLALIFISVIFSFRNMDQLWQPFASNSRYSYTEHLTENEIERILIDIHNMRIVIREYDGDYVKIRHPENEHFRLNESENTLSLTRDQRNINNWFSINLNFYIPEVVVMVPSDLILTYDITTSNARINVRSIAMLESTFRTSNSVIELRNVISDYTINTRSSNGRIELNNIEAYELIAVTSNARINVDNVLADSLSLTTSNGRIESNNVEANVVNFTTSNSRIGFRDLKANTIDLRSSNGRIEGTVIGNSEEFQKNIQTSNGRIMLNGQNRGTSVMDNMNAEQTINARTSNGRIDIDFR